MKKKRTIKDITGYEFENARIAMGLSKLELHRLSGVSLHTIDQCEKLKDTSFGMFRQICKINSKHKLAVFLNLLEN